MITQKHVKLLISQVQLFSVSFIIETQTRSCNRVSAKFSLDEACNMTFRIGEKMADTLASYL